MLIPPSGEESVVISYGILTANILIIYELQTILNKKNAADLSGVFLII